MHFSSALLLAVSGFAAAQSMTSAYNPAGTAAGSTCNNALEALVNNCLKTEMPKVTGCAANDWSCLCSAQQQVITCFNNCPSDPRAYGEKQSETQWCAAAKTYPSSTTHYPQPKPTKAPAPVSSSPHKSGGHSSGSGSSGSNSGGDNGARALGAPLAGAAVMLVGAIALL